MSRNLKKNTLHEEFRIINFFFTVEINIKIFKKYGMYIHLINNNSAKKNILTCSILSSYKVRIQKTSITQKAAMQALINMFSKAFSVL